MTFFDEGISRWEKCNAGGSGDTAIGAATERYLLVVGSKAARAVLATVRLTSAATQKIYGVTDQEGANPNEAIEPYNLSLDRRIRIKRRQKLRCRVTTAYKASGATDALIGSGSALNSRIYRGAVSVAPNAESGNQVILLLDSNGDPDRFQTSTGNAAYQNATVAAALGSTGKFLGTLSGAEAGSDNVSSLATARAYFDVNPDRFTASNAYYYFDGRTLRRVVYTPGNFGNKISPSADSGQRGWGVMGSSGEGTVVSGETIDGKHYADFFVDKSA